MAIDSMHVDRLKKAVTDTLVDALLRYHLEPAEIEVVGHQVLAEIDSVLGDDIPADQLAIGRRVRSLRIGTPEDLGTVSKLISTAGELHTVLVSWDGFVGDEPVSPSQIELVTA